MLSSTRARAPLALLCAGLLTLTACGSGAENGDTAEENPVFGALSDEPASTQDSGSGEDSSSDEGAGSDQGRGSDEDSSSDEDGGRATEPVAAPPPGAEDDDAAPPGAEDDGAPHTSDPSPEATEEERTGAGRATILFTGDVSPERTIAQRILQDGPEVPWEGIADELAAVDLRVTNLETTVGSAGVAEPKRFPFQSPPEAVDSLLAAGFEVASLANNHTYDYGPEGLLETIELVEDAGIVTVGAGADDEAARAPGIVEVEGVELAFLGYLQIPTERNGYSYHHWPAGPDKPGVAWANPDEIAEDVAAVVDEVDHVVVLLHSGYEYARTVNEFQTAAAEAAFDAGATAVVGHHPHVLQGWSFEDGRLVAWSLGNTAFAGFADPETLRTALLNVTFTRDEIEEVEWLPAVVDGHGFPNAVDPDGDVGRSILEELDTLPVPELASWGG